MARSRSSGAPATSKPLPPSSRATVETKVVIKSLARDGYSQHGDYVFGWKDDSLQRAMDNLCFGDVCEGLGRQSPEEAMECTIPPTVKDDIDGCKSAALPPRWFGASARSRGGPGTDSVAN